MGSALPGVALRRRLWRFESGSSQATPRIATIKISRSWRIKRDYEKLKQALGLGHYGGRNWRGFHYQASSCFAAYGFLTLEQRSSRKKTPLDSNACPAPGLLAARGCRPGSAMNHIDRHLSLPLGPHNRQSTVSVPLLWPSESRAIVF